MLLHEDDNIIVESIYLAIVNTQLTCKHLKRRF